MKKSLLSLRHVKQSRSQRFVAACLLVFCCMSLSIAQVSLVKDLNWYDYDLYAYEFTNMCESNDRIYFEFRQALWISDGTDDGTVLLKQFESVTNLTPSGDYLYFAADDGASGTELWRTDGTLEGTVMIKDIYPGLTSSAPSQLRDLNGTLYFAANDGLTGVELWKSNGTAAGTVLVKDILKIKGSSNPQNLVVVNNKLFFRANDGANGYELWSTDGTASGTAMVVDINKNLKIGANPEQIVNANGMLYFFANDGVNGKQLWKSNGSTNNATLVKTIVAGGTPNLDHLTSVGSLVFFQANDRIHGAEIWRSDGTAAGTFLLFDATPGPGSDTDYATPHLDHFKESNGKLFFLATVAGKGMNMYTSDGTTAGTVQITQLWEDVGYSWIDPDVTPYNGTTIFAGLGESTPELWKSDGTREGSMEVHGNISNDWYINTMFTELNGLLYFIGQGDLWRTDGTREGTMKIKVFGSPQHSKPNGLTDVNGTLFFEATSDGYNNTLYRTNGTDESTIDLKYYLLEANSIRNINGKVYFAGKDYQGEEVWTSDGTEEGTTQLKDIANDGNYHGSYPTDFTSLNNEVLFSASAYLWKTNGSEEGTTIVDPGPYSLYYPRNLILVNGKVFFLAHSGQSGEELCVTDGTTSSLVKDIKANSGTSGAIRFTPFKNILYFQADNYGSGYELWRSDGTRTGTYMVKDIRTGDLGTTQELAPIDMGNMIATEEAFYFTAVRGTGINALWRSDGSNLGTRVIKEFSGQPKSHIISAIGNKIYFTLSYGSQTELWTSEGTSASTIKINTMPVLGVVEPYQVAVSGNVIYFLAHDASTNRIWRTDGTALGTREILFPGNPIELETSGGKVYVSGHSVKYGWELFTINETSGFTQSAAGRVKSDEGVISVENEVELTSYPNPFNTSFSLRVEGNEEDSFQMNVVGIDGKSIDQLQLRYNENHEIGNTWNTGLYIVQVHTGKKILVRKVLKTN